MKKKMLKIVIIFLVLTIIILISMPSSFGSIPTEGIEIGSPSLGEGVDVGNRILGIVQLVGVFLSVIILVILGLKYMMGSVAEKADFKKSLPIYILGVFLLFGTTTFAGLIYEIVSNF